MPDDQCSLNIARVGANPRMQCRKGVAQARRHALYTPERSGTRARTIGSRVATGLANQLLDTAMSADRQRLPNVLRKPSPSAVRRRKLRSRARFFTQALLLVSQVMVLALGETDILASSATKTLREFWNKIF